MTLRILILSVFFSTSLFLNGQDLVVANSKMNILYIGVPNPIQFASKKVPISKIVLTAQRGEIISSNGQFFYQNCRNEIGELIIYAKNKQTNQIIDSTLFRLKNFPDPTVRISGSNMSEGVYMGKDIISDMDGIWIKFNNDYEIPVTIVSFKITITNSAGPKIILINEGNSITPNVKSELSKIVNSDTVVMHDILIRVGCVVKPRLLRQEIKLK